MSVKAQSWWQGLRDADLQFCPKETLKSRESVNERVKGIVCDPSTDFVITQQEKNLGNDHYSNRTVPLSEEEIEKCKSL